MPAWLPVALLAAAGFTAWAVCAFLAWALVRVGTRPPPARPAVVREAAEAWPPRR
jgi:hypothetical protein